MKLQEAKDLCMQTVWKGTPGEVTAEINSQAALNFFGGTSNLKSLKTGLLSRYVLHLSDKGNSSSTINRKLAALSKMIAVGIQHGAEIPMPSMPYQKERPARQRYLSQAEEIAMLNYFTDRGGIAHAQAMIFLIDTGMRPSELWRMTFQDVQDGLVTIPKTKNGRPRVLPLTLRCNGIVARRRAMTSSDEVFPYNNAWMERGWKAAKRCLGLASDKEFVVYALRHTCASRLIQGTGTNKGQDLHIVGAYLGHTDLKQTLRYAHLSLANLQQAVAHLERVIESK